MEQDKIIAVGKMQKYIDIHFDEEITLDDLCRASGYSKFHCERIFKELTGKTPFQTIRALRLTKAAKTLIASGEKVVDVALDNGFDSHDGFTRAFTRRFLITPQKYRQEAPPVNWFVHYPVQAYYTMKEGKPMQENKFTKFVTVTAVQRPKRKLILLRSVNATDYFSYCEETGCDWEGIFNSVSEKFDAPALLTLPKNCVRAGTGCIASGVEVPFEYGKTLPEGYEIIDLPPCTMLYFQGSPYEDENDFGMAIESLWEIMEAYDPTQYGFRYAPELAPYFNFGADCKTGAKMALPVEAIIK